MYFDLVVHNVTKPLDNNYKPLYFNNKSQPPLKHSGDIRPDRNNPSLLQYLNISREHTTNVKGIVSAQGYNRQSFLKIQSCDPHLCLVDYDNPDEIKLYLIH